MGWMHADLHDEHEGYPAFVTADGQTTSASTGAGVLIWPDDGDPEILVPWAAVVARQAGCACGWQGDRWERAATLPGQHGGNDPEDAFLPDGTSIEDLARACWQAHIEPLTRLGAIRRAHAAAHTAQHDLEIAVAAARESGATWRTSAVPPAPPGDPPVNGGDGCRVLGQGHVDVPDNG